MTDNKLPFAKIAQSALNQAELLLGEWLPDGKKIGHEWKAINPTRSDSKVGSFSINVENGMWGDFATGDSGKDLVALYAYLFHAGDQGKAAVELAERFNIPLLPLKHAKGKPDTAQPAQEVPAADVPTPDTPAPPAESVAEKEPRTYWQPLRPVPADAPPPPRAQEYRGIPQQVTTYREADGQVIGYIYRFVTSDGGKEFQPLVYARHAKSGKCDWKWIIFSADKRPVYGLDRAAAKPEATLLITEGEKCADAAHEQLPELASISWPGGSNSTSKIDFEVLASHPTKKAILWPDADAKRERLSKQDKDEGVLPDTKPYLPLDKQAGFKAMKLIADRLLAIGFKVWFVDIGAPGEKPDGWDIADAVAGGLTGPALAEFIRANCLAYTGPEKGADVASNAISTPSEANAGKRENRGPGEEWIPDLVYRKGELSSCLSNVYQILKFNSVWKGVVAFDEMALCAVKRKPPPYAEGCIGEWDAQDDSRTAMWISRVYGIAPSSATVLEAIEVLSRANGFHPVREWLRSIKWDGNPRLESMLTDHVGAKLTPYTMMVGKWWLMGAVKRVLQPGAKFDYCLVLSGDQGKKKSTFFSALGGQWFGDTDLDLSSKDSMSGLKGKLIYEFAELGSLARSEEKKQKSFLSRSIDEYRPTYGRREIKAPRQVVFCGTTNDHEWNKDPTGGRRFWPVDCLFDEIDVAKLLADRDQLFAEALHYVEAGERYWPTQAEQRQYFDPEQLRIEQQDSMVDWIHDWVYSQVSNFSIFDLASDRLKLDASKLTPQLQTRIGIALRKLGCTRIERRNGMIRYWYKPPVRNGASSTSDVPADNDGSAHDLPI